MPFVYRRIYAMLLLIEILGCSRFANTLARVY